MKKAVLLMSLLFATLFMNLSGTWAQEGHTITYVLSKDLMAIVNVGKPEDNVVVTPGETKVPAGADLTIIVPLLAGQGIEEITLNGEKLSGADGVYLAKMPAADAVLLIRLALNYDPASAVPVSATTNISSPVYACAVAINGGEPELDVKTLMPLPMTVARGEWAGLYIVCGEGDELIDVKRIVEMPENNTTTILALSDLEPVKKGGKTIAYTDKYGFEAAGKETALKYKVRFKTNGHIINVKTDGGATVDIKKGEEHIEAAWTQVAKETELTLTIKANEGKEIELVTFDGKSVQLTNGVAKVVMPDKDVDLVVNTKLGTSVCNPLFMQIFIAPNPFTDVLRVMNVELQGATYEVLNAQGVVALSGVLAQGETLINTQALNAGLYFVRIVAADGEAKAFNVLKK